MVAVMAVLEQAAIPVHFGVTSGIEDEQRAVRDHCSAGAICCSPLSVGSSCNVLRRTVLTSFVGTRAREKARRNSLADRATELGMR